MKPFYLLLCTFLLQTSLFSQVSITLTADMDNTIFSEGEISNGAGTSFFCGLTASGNKRRALLHFNLSSLPADAVIGTATLNLFVNKITNGSGLQPIEAHVLLANWGEGTSSGSGGGAAATTNDATWSTRFTGTVSPWSTAGGDFTPAISGSVLVGATGATSIAGADFNGRCTIVDQYSGI